VLQFQIHNKTVEYPRLCNLYALSVGDPAFAAYPTLEELLTALSRRGGADPATVAHPVRRPDEAAGFAQPGLVGDRAARVPRHARAAVEPPRRRGAGRADALVAWAMLEAMMRVRPWRDPMRIAMYLRQEMRRVLFAQLQREARARRHLAEDEEDDDEASEDATSYDVVDPDTLADPVSLVPIEERIVVWEPTPGSVSDEDLLRAHAVRGGLRRLTRCLFEHASERHREQVYRQLLRRAQQLIARRK
jgi:hypothetical protein